MIIMDEDTRRESLEAEVENKNIDPGVCAKVIFPKNFVYHACHKHSASLYNENR